MNTKICPKCNHLSVQFDSRCSHWLCYFDDCSFNYRGHRLDSMQVYVLTQLKECILLQESPIGHHFKFEGLHSKYDVLYNITNGVMTYIEPHDFKQSWNIISRRRLLRCIAKLIESV
jgi:hypothetical protein